MSFIVLSPLSVATRKRRATPRKKTRRVAGLQPVVPGVAALVPIVGRRLDGVGDRGDSLDVLESEFHRREQPQGRAVFDLEHLSGQMRSEQGLRVSSGRQVDR